MPGVEFEERLRREVQTLAARYDVTEDKSFLMWSGEQILEIDVDDAYEAAVVGGANDLCLDFGYIDEEAETIILAQGKFSTDVKRETIRALRELPEILSSPEALRARKANAEVTAFARKFRTRKNRGFKVRLLIVHLGALAAPTTGELGTDVEDYGVDRLKEAHDERSPLVLSVPPPRIGIRVEKTMYFKLEDRPGKARCLIVGIPLTELHRLYQEHGSGLLERNVRLFVGKKTPANRGMVQTLCDPVERKNFFYYNNGLCFLTTRIDKPDTNNGTVTIGLHNPQIVNGGQTYVTVGTSDEDNLEDAQVLARIICPPEGEAREKFTDSVIRDTNTQTPVTSRDFHANDPIQKRLLEMFSKLDPAWFYERKAGLWDSMEPKNKVRFKVHDPKVKFKYRVIDNEELAKCILAWNQRPALPKTRSRKIFEERVSEDGLYTDIFPPGCDNDDFVRDGLLAFELNLLLRTRRDDWVEQKRKAKEGSNGAALHELEQFAFIPFFNYFCLASMRYMAETYYSESGPNFLTDNATFSAIYDFLLRTYRFVIENARKRDQGAGRIFSLANWFKQDSSYLEEVRPAIDNNMAFSKLQLPGTAPKAPTPRPPP